MAEKPLSATTTMRRPGSQRAICKIICRAQSVRDLYLRPLSRVERSEGASTVRNGSAHTLCAQGRGTRSMAESHRNPLALTK